MSSDNYLGPRGYVLYKSNLTEKELIELKQELTVTPYTADGYGQPAESFKNYQESTTKLYLPRYYALQKFGVPKINKLNYGKEITVKFTGSLRPLQVEAVKAVLDCCNDPSKMGALLCLSCGQGKTISAIYMLCTLAKKTLIVVHKEFLLEQWKERIQEFAPSARIGLIKAKVIDVENKDIVLASLQSLSMKDYDEGVFDEFGCVVIDEAHRTAAEVFSRALKKINFKYAIGLTATPKRKDGMTKVFKWYLGDIAYESKKVKDSVEVRFHRYYSSNSAYSKVHTLYNKNPNMSRMINSICEFIPRVDFLCDIILDILKNEPERRLLVLSDRRQHLHLIKEGLDKHELLSNGFYVGGMKQSDLKISEAKQIILGTFQIAAEGLDIKGLNTLILASPKSDVIQISGRILRDRVEDRLYDPLIIDICDDFSIFPNQAKKRNTYYKKCKYEIIDNDNIFVAKNKPNKLIELPKNVCCIEDE